MNQSRLWPPVGVVAKITLGFPLNSNDREKRQHATWDKGTKTQQRHKGERTRQNHRDKKRKKREEKKRKNENNNTREEREKDGRRKKRKKEGKKETPHLHSS